MKYIDILKKFFLVYDQLKDNGWRLSKISIATMAGIVGGLMMAAGAIPLGFEDDLQAVILGLLTSGWNAYLMFERVRSSGGKTKMRVEMDAKLQGSGTPTDDDEYPLGHH